MVESNDDIPWADNAIPKDAISLTDAHGYIVGLLSDHPEIVPEFDDEWSEALRKSREAEGKIGHDPETFDIELEEEWHRRKVANLFLRLEIEAKELVACIRDPETGDILQLRSDGWVPIDWDDYIPPGIWNDYIIPGDYEAPGPNGSLIRGALQPVFFMRGQFETWFKETFGGIESTATSEPNSKIELNRDRKHKQAAVREAFQALWGQHGPPPGVDAINRNAEIKEWLSKNGRAVVGEATIRRALKEN